MKISELISKSQEYLPRKDQAVIKNAYDFAEEAHKEQKRFSGEPYIQHPLEVAYFLAQMHIDSQTLVAALLHDIPEDTQLTLKDIEKNFGKEITQLVNGVTKLGKVRIKKAWFEEEEFSDENPEFSAQIEILRKMFMAMVGDVRIILIKLADRRHNMQTLQFVARDKQLRIAKETMEIFARIADRLGMGELRGELEDLAFPYVYPKENQELKKRVTHLYKDKEKYLEKVKKTLLKELVKHNIKAEIHGRAKHLYSLYKKLKKYDNDMSKIYDLVALRIIVHSVQECYEVLGIIHTMWKPLFGRIKDYIAMPKPNGYQSLHTTVFCLDGKIVEFQIRTYDMHYHADFGVAAHWFYTETNKGQYPIHKAGLVPQDKLRWIKELAEWQEKLKDPKELAEALKFDFLQDRIFVFTPKGDVVELPTGSTTVDFAYRIHSEVGNRCIGAKINGKMVNLGTKINNGDMVEILTSKKSPGPKQDWLKFAKTHQSRSRIKAYLYDKIKKERME